MSLLTRLTQPLEGEEKLPVHQFMGALAEYKRGAPGVNLNSIAVAFGLSDQEKNQLQDFISGLDQDLIDRSLIHDVLMLGEGGQYTVAQCSNRLGL